MNNVPAEAGFTELPRRQVVPAATCVVLAMFLAALSQTVVATAMPRIIADIGGFDRYVWAVTSYLVAATVAYPIVGRLSDLYGRRLFILVGLAIFIAGSALVGSSASMAQLVLFRAVQGAGGGIIMTSSYVAIADLFRPQDRGKFHGLIGAVYGVASVAGPIMGGVIAEHLSWHWIFVLIAVLGVPVLFLAARYYPALRPASTGTEKDYPGMIALLLALVPLLLSLSSWGIQPEGVSPRTIVLLVVGLAMSVVFVVIESRAKAPIMPLQVFANRVMAPAVAMTLLSSFALYGGVIFLPLFFQVVLHVSTTGSGNLLVPMLLGIVFGGVLSGQLLSRTGARYQVQAVVSTGFLVAGMSLVATMDGSTNIVQSVVYIVAAGFGFGGIVATVSIAAQNTVPFAQVGVATSALQFYRSVGGMLGLAVLGSVLTRRFASRLEETVPESARAALPEGRFEAMKRAPEALLDPTVAQSLQAELAEAGPAGAAMAEPLLDGLRAALTGAVDDVFTIVAVVTALSFAAALLFRVQAHPPADAGHPDPADPAELT